MGSLDNCLWLIEEGADRNIRDYTNRGNDFQLNALDWANKQGFGEIILLLEDVEKACCRGDWKPGSRFVGRGRSEDDD